MPKIDNEGAQGTAAFDDTRGDVVRGTIDVDLMGKEFSKKWLGQRYFVRLLPGKPGRR